MILEAMLFRSFANGGSIPLGDGGGTSVSDLDYASCVMVLLMVVIIYLILVSVAVYSVLMCNNKNPLWMVVNLLVAVFAPTLYLLIHSNLVLAHRGPKSYCDTD
jgi:O-antigen/teichoic acid export membrane protein